MDFEEYEKLKEVDEKRTWKAVYIAVIFHAVIFLAQWNVFQADSVIKDDKAIFDVKVYVPPPPPPEEPQVKRQRTVFKPIPDPTPDKPKVDIVEIPDDYWEPSYDNDYFDEYDYGEIMPTAQIMQEYEVSEPPQRISGEDPRYPEIARAARVQGNVIAYITVGADGRVLDVQILRGIKGAFEEYFNNEVKRAAMNYRYKPAIHQGKPVPVRIQFTFTFKLN